MRSAQRIGVGGPSECAWPHTYTSIHNKRHTAWPPISDFNGGNPGLGHFGRNRPKVATSVPSTCGSPSPCADTSFGPPRGCRTLQPPSDFQLILSTRTDVTLALILGPSFYSLLTPSRLGRAHTSTCPAAASRPAHSALGRLGTPGCVGSGQRF